MKLLWADDQQDIVNTFRNLLAPLDLNIEFVQDATEALNRLKTEFYELLILDLMMPPDKWGGLWLLEEIHKSNVRIPTIILSGEGTQSETIKALRLGAKDYVTKDNVQTDLLERVRIVLKEAAAEIEMAVTTSFPSVLAIPYKRYLNTTAPNTQLRRLFEFHESCLRFCCIIGFCEFATLAAETDLSSIVKKIAERPTMGTWNSIRRELGKQLPREAVFFQIDDTIDNNLLDSVIKLRNDISHGSEPSERAAKQKLDDLTPHLQAFLRRLWQRLNFQIILPVSLYFDGSNYQITGHEIAGSSISLPKFVGGITTPVNCDEPYVLVKSGQEHWINLYPLISVEPSLEPNTWHILMFDSMRKSGIRYIDIWSGDRNVSSEIDHEGLEKFLNLIDRGGHR